MGGMGVLIVFAAGVSVGFAVDKLYKVFVVNNEQRDGELVAVAGEEDVSDLKIPLNKAAANATENDAIRNKQSVKEKASDNQHGELGQLKGAGPKLVEALGNIGIYSYAELSSSSVDILFERLKETGGRFSRPVVLSVIEQARLVMRGIEEA